MSDDPLDLLLDRLCQGDPRAAEQMVEAYAPYLRAVVRRSLPDQLRAKFDSLDVVQSVWVHVLRGLQGASWKFADRNRLRALLVQLTHRRLISRYRHLRHDLERAAPGQADVEQLPASSQPRPSEVAQAEELWQRMLAACPPAHHELLQLRRQGLRLNEIAARTGMHEGSVRRILRQLARQIALEPRQAAEPCGQA
jgi:RNA polymerase sigma-70 factor (ECF subfamily)